MTRYSASRDIMYSTPPAGETADESDAEESESDAAEPEAEEPTPADD